MLKASQLVRTGREKLAGVDNGDREAEYLFESVYGCRYYEMPDGADCRPLSRTYLKLIERRLSGEPLQYIIGRAPFLDFELAVRPGVLIPRPDTEAAALAAIDAASPCVSGRAADLCSGSGCIGIALARACPGWKVDCVEISSEAFSCLEENIRSLAPENAAAVRGDALRYLEDNVDTLDLIACNPPYLTRAEMSGLQEEVQREPALALYGGEDGLEYYRKLTGPAYCALRKGGTLVYETGDGESEPVFRIVTEAGFREARTITDKYGLERAIEALK
ncbi:MAG: peptide chain release factor N(5)-glutamine methyltransferase [Oscillospiraceae bacterium]|jgi:release factor glutamine methyltransferase